MGLITDEKRQAIIADRMANLPTKEIAEKHGVHVVTVHKIVRHLSLPKRKTGPKGKFSPEEKDAIVVDYKSMSICMLVDKYKSAWETLKRVLDERGIKTRKEAGEVIRRNTKIRPEDHPEIVRKYVEEDKDSVDLAPEYGVSQAIISRIIARAGVTRSNSESKRKYACDESAFDAITDESAYWIGMLMTDGTGIESAGHSPAVSLTLKEGDAAHVEKYKSFLKAEHPIMPVRSSGNTKDLPNMYARLSIRSRKLADALAKNGVVPNKVYRTAATPELANNHHFWRGVIDGDGCLYDGKHASGLKLALVGTQELLEQFRSYSESVSSRSKATARKIKNSRAFQIHLTGVHAARLIHALYKDAPIFLDRKMAIAMSVIGNPDYDLEKMEKASLLYRPKS